MRSHKFHFYNFTIHVQNLIQNLIGETKVDNFNKYNLPKRNKYCNNNIEKFRHWAVNNSVKITGMRIF